MERRRPFCKLFPEESMWRRLRGACAAGNPPFVVPPILPPPINSNFDASLSLSPSLSPSLFFRVVSFLLPVFSLSPCFLLLLFARNRFPRRSSCTELVYISRSATLSNAPKLARKRIKRRWILWRFMLPICPREIHRVWLMKEKERGIEGRW